jgi:hypothetical protein
MGSQRGDHMRMSWKHQMTSRHFNRAKSMLAFGVQNLDPQPLETFRFGQVAQTILWDEPIASHHVSRNFSLGCVLGEPVEML